jgi:drug/metabolite transporter (DMT)-like permease
MLSAILASGASVAWGSADFLAGVSSRRLGLITVLFVSQLVGMVFLLPVLTATGETAPALSYVGLGVLAGAFNAAALTAFYRGLARGPMGLVASIAATEAIIPVTFGVLHGERPSAMGVVGIALALAGVVLASGAANDNEPGRRIKSVSVSVALGVVAAICFGFFVVALKGASGGGALWAATVSRVTTIGLLMLAMPVARSKFSIRLNGRDIAAILTIGVLDVAANILLALATTSGAIGVVGVLSSFYPVVTILLAGVVLRERLGRLQRLGTVGALVGVALIGVR